ncbi:MAG: hypothetical protein WC332_00375 [Clostridia bacterium]|jgi:hypothetical protein
MKKTRYRVYFESNRLCIIWAFCEKEAMILAQAEEIKKGNNYNVKSITEC